MTSEDKFDALLDEVRRADRAMRIELRDGIAEHGTTAISPMADWLDDREFAAFAVRVLERIGRMDGQLQPVIRALSDGHATAATLAIAGDIEEALRRLGSRLMQPETQRSRRGSGPPPSGRPGKPGRQYWAMRTSVAYPDFIWAEVRRGRLRQGWGWMEEQAATNRRSKAGWRRPDRRRGGRLAGPPDAGHGARQRVERVGRSSGSRSWSSGNG